MSAFERGQSPLNKMLHRAATALRSALSLPPLDSVFKPLSI